MLSRMAGWRHDPALGELEAHAARKKVAHCVCCRHPGNNMGCTS